MDYVLKYKEYLNTFDYGVSWHWEGNEPTLEKFDEGVMRVSLDDWDAGVVGPLVVKRLNGLLGDRLSADVLRAYPIWVKDCEFELRVLEDRAGRLVSDVLEDRDEDVRAIYVALEYELYLDHGNGTELEPISPEDVFDLRLEDRDGFIV